MNIHAPKWPQPSLFPIARRTTYDDHSVLLWADGSFTTAFGTRIDGLPFRARSGVDREHWLLMGDVGIYERHELPQLWAAARWASKRTALPGDMRARFAALSSPALPRLAWEVTDIDHRGVVRERRADLPRLLFPGRYTIFHNPGAVKPYGLWSAVQRYAPGGCREALEIVQTFKNLRGVWEWLYDERRLNDEAAFTAVRAQEGGR